MKKLISMTLKMLQKFTSFNNNSVKNLSLNCNSPKSSQTKEESIVENKYLHVTREDSEIRMSKRDHNYAKFAALSKEEKTKYIEDVKISAKKHKLNFFNGEVRASIGAIKLTVEWIEADLKPIRGRDIVVAKKYDSWKHIYNTVEKCYLNHHYSKKILFEAMELFYYHTHKRKFVFKKRENNTKVHHSNNKHSYALLDSSIEESFYKTA